MEAKFGLMEQNMKANGSEIRQTGEESFGMLMVIFMMENGKMIKQTATEYIFM